MEQENKYYTPDWNELHLGDIIECWHSYDIPRFEHDIFNGWEIDTLKKYLADGAMRVKYLDQSDIESCGWTDIKDVERWMGRPPMYTWSARKDNVIMGYNSEDHTIVIDIRDPTKTVDGKNDEYNFPEIKYGRFRGECKSINELRKIMQWLNIK